MSAVETEVDLQPLFDLCRDAALANPESIETAVDAALVAAAELPEWGNCADALVRRAITEMVGTARHNANVAMRSQSGEYDTRAKVVAGEAAGKVYRSHYLYLIAGKTLGQLTGAELLTTAEAEENRASGHIFNAKLCRKLAELTPDDKTVSESVSQRKMQSIWKSLR